MKVPSVYTSSFVKKALKFANNNPAVLSATTSLLFAGIVRPFAIMMTPNTEKENKKHAVAKSISSKVSDFIITTAIATPFAKAIENIDNNPKKFLKEETIKNLQGDSKTLIASKDYRLATQLFKLGLGLFIVAPKQYLTTKFISPILKSVFPEKKEKKDGTQINFKNFPKTYAKINQEKTLKQNNKLSFKGSLTDKISSDIGKILDKDGIQNFSKKFSNTKFEMHLINLTDILSTFAFVQLLKKNKKIKEEKKKPLIYNSIISASLSIVGLYGVDKLTQKPTQKFIEKFKEINKNSPDLDKYVNGIKVLKPVLILAGLYYTIIPVIATYASDKIDKKVNFPNSK